MADLRALGVSLDWPAADIDTELKEPHFPNGCYLYRGQERDHVISVSNEFFAAYKAIGFSRESLCMALVSEARFDPETGERLPTYVYRDDTVLDRHLDSLDPGTMTPEVLENYVPALFPSKARLKTAIKHMRNRNFSGYDTEQLSALVPAEHHTYELPLRVPPCFKNGTPLLDCKWTYGLRSGRKLSANAPKKYREVGEFLDQAITEHLKTGSGKSPYPADDPYFKKTPATGKYLHIERLFADSLEPGVDFNPNKLVLNLPPGLSDWATLAAWYAKSSNLPRGYGYALYAWSAYAETGGPAISAAGLRMAFDGTRKITHSKLIRIKDALR